MRKKFAVTKKTEIEKESKLWQHERDWKKLPLKEREIQFRDVTKGDFGTRSYTK